MSISTIAARFAGVSLAAALLFGPGVASVALDVTPGTYGPTTDSFNPANAPGSSHLTSGTVECVVESDLSIDCSAYVLGGVGHTNATVNLQGTYSATIDCTNHGGNLVESHTTTFGAASPPLNISSKKNGQLNVPSVSASPFSAPQVCPNPNWTPSIRENTLVLHTFDYTLTFEGFTSPYIEITKTDP